jgi:radical SAM superfamily enzyme YgiQ (UPF0313 family)
MRVLLVQPPASPRVGLGETMRVEPLALETVAGALVDEHQVEILDTRLDGDLRGCLERFRPHALGISASFTPEVYGVYQILDLLRREYPHIRTFVGGHHATQSYQDFAGKVDAVVLGEGEVTARELLRCWEEGRDLGEVAGIAYQRRGTWATTPPRPFLPDLDWRPDPARGLVARYQRYYYQGSWRPTIYVESARGCPYRCTFCSVWRFHRKSFRMRSPERVVQELMAIGSPYVVFADDNFFVDAGRAQRIARRIKEAGLRKHYWMNLRSDAVVGHAKVIEEWAEIGLCSVFIGFEAITQEGLDAFNKRLALRTNEEAIKILRGLGIKVFSSFIVDPGFGTEDFEALYRYVRHLKLDRPLFTVLTPLPGTDLYQEQYPNLTTRDYRLFDLQHAVLPTRLGLEGFYRQYTRLYRRAYLAPGALLRLLTSEPLPSFLRLLGEVWSLRSALHPRVFLKDHLAPAPGGDALVPRRKTQVLVPDRRWPGGAGSSAPRRASG